MLNNAQVDDNNVNANISPQCKLKLSLMQYQGHYKSETILRIFTKYCSSKEARKSLIDSKYVPIKH